MDEDKKPTEESNTDPIETRLNDELEKDDTGPVASGIPSAAEESNPSPQSPLVTAKPEGRFKRFIKTKKGKAIVIILGFLVVLGALWLVPMTRYGILGTFIKKATPLVVIDSVTKKPVTEASIQLGSLSAKTDNEGKVTLQDVPVGEYKAKITKNYYTTAELPVTVPIFGESSETRVDLVATGRQVSILVIDTITKKPLEKATITVGETSSTSDVDGIATIVLPAEQEKMTGQVKLEGYNQADIEVAVTDQANANKITLTPMGTVYFLSKQTGKINVMKSNLDGTGAAVVVEGTGTESDGETTLLSARDWQYMALSAKRKSTASGQLYVVDAKNGSLKTVDEGNVTIELIGWSDHNFLYVVTRNEKKIWEDKRQALKSYNADTGALTTIDESYGVGTSLYDAQYEIINSPYIVEGKIIYTKPLFRELQTVFTPTDRKSTIVIATPSNGQKQVLKEFSSNKSVGLQARLYEAQEVYFRVAVEGSPVAFFEYESGALKSVTNSDDKFYNTFYPTFLISPDGQRTLWHEPRNGKNAIFVGDKNGKNSKELAIDSEYTTYGWFTDKYILLSKNKSELYIAPVDQQIGEVTKIANYHKPAFSFTGYGYGYGGL